MDGCTVVVIALVFTFLSQLNNRLSDDWKSRICNRFNPYFSQLAAKLKEKNHLVEANNSISAQDNYAQWTKNNRKLDTLKKEIDQLKENLLEFNKTKLNQWNKLTKVLITLPFLGFKLWKGKQIVYELPSNRCFPSVINGVWHNGFLFVAMAPLNFLRFGSIHQLAVTETFHFGVSLGIWCWALNTVISTIEFIVNQLFLQEKVQTPSTKATKSS